MNPIRRWYEKRKAKKEAERKGEQILSKYLADWHERHKDDMLSKEEVYEILLPGMQEGARAYKAQQRQRISRSLRFVVCVFAVTFVLIMLPIGTTWGDHWLFGRNTDDSENTAPITPHFTVQADGIENIGKVNDSGACVTTWLYKEQTYTIIEEHNELGNTIRISDAVGSTDYEDAPAICGAAVMGYQDEEGCNFFTEFKSGNSRCVLRISTTAMIHADINYFLSSIVRGEP